MRLPTISSAEPAGYKMLPCGESGLEHRASVTNRQIWNVDSVKCKDDKFQLKGDVETFFGIFPWIEPVLLNNEYIVFAEILEFEKLTENGQWRMERSECRVVSISASSVDPMGWVPLTYSEVEFLNSEELSLIKSSPLPAQLPRPGRS